MDSSVFWIKVQFVGYLFSPLCVLAVASLLNRFLNMLAGMPARAVRRAAKTP
jgi:hypothetical protein